MEDKQLLNISATEFYKMVDKDAIKETYKHILTNNLSLKASTKYSVLVNNEPYPPKDFLRIMAQLKGYKINESTLNGGQANTPFKNLNYTIINNKEYPFYNASMLQPQIRKYQNAIEHTDWLKIREIYKFYFVKWIEENIDFNTDSDNEIKSKIEQSQQITYSPNSKTKGVNFIQTITRYQDDYITLEDVQKLRKIVNQELPENKENLTLSFGSFPKTSAFLSFFNPEKYIAYDAESLPAYAFLSKGVRNSAAPKRNYNAFQFYQTFYQNIKKHLKESHLDVSTFKEILQLENLSELQWNFIAQDFLLYITREIMNKKEIPAYYCVGFNYYDREPNSQLRRFIENDIWENGYDDKFQNVVNSVPLGSLIAAKTTYTMSENDKTISVLEIHCIGEVIENNHDGKILKVNWKKDFKPFKLKRKGGYRSTISKVNDENNIKAIFYKADSLQELEIEEELSINTSRLNQILYGPPGTGKTYKTKELAVKIIDGVVYENREDLTERYFELMESGQIHFTTFHQSMSYEDFMEGIKPKIDNEEGEISYEITDGIFKVIVEKAKENINNATLLNNNTLPFSEAFIMLKEDWEDNTEMQFSLKREGSEFTLLGFTNKSIKFKKASGGIGHTLSINTLRELYYGERDFTNRGIGIYYPSIVERLQSYKKEKTRKNIYQKYVLIIDEINRGNVSAIFGELITLIEKDKRAGQDEAIEVTLPYSKEKFSVPKNIHIIGTMNTADRSVEALDTALRRRFSFEEILPKPELLSEIDYKEIDLVKLLKTINERIELLIDKDHTIGHSYFFNIKTFEDLKTTFKDKIIPLLEEYFYGDFGKIGLVLGSNFVNSKESKNKNILAQNFKFETDFIEEKELYEFVNADDWTIETFTSIYLNTPTDNEQ